MKNTVTLATTIGFSALSAPVGFAQQAHRGEQEQRRVESATPVVQQPTYLKLHDGNLLRVIQEGQELRFSVTCSGYGGEGYSVQLKGFGADVNKATANVYIPVTVLEALALVDGNWLSIVNAAEGQKGAALPGVDPALLRQTLMLFAVETPGVKTVTLPAPRLQNAARQILGARPDPLDLESWDIGELGRSSTDTAFFDPRGWAPKVSEPVYLRVAVDGQVLLRVTQEGDTLSFAKTSSGYAEVGGKGTIDGVGGGADITVGMMYFAVEPLEVLTLLDGDWHKVYAAVEKQSRIIAYSVDPQLVAAAFKQYLPEFAKKNATKQGSKDAGSDTAAKDGTRVVPSSPPQTKSQPPSAVK